MACGLARNRSGSRTTSGNRSCPSTTSPSGLLPTDFDQVEHGLGRDAVAGDLVLLDLDLQHRLAGDLLDGDVGGAVNRVQHRFDLGGLLDQHVEVVAEELDAHVGAHAGDHFVDPHFDRLREGEFLPRHVAERLVEQFGELGLRAWPSSTGSRGLRVMKMSVSSTPIGSVATSADADAAPDVLHLVGELGEDHLLHPRVVADRLVEVGSRQPHHADGDRRPRTAGARTREPRCGAIMPKATISTLTAKPTTAALWFMANCSTGRWIAWAIRISSGSRSSILLRQQQAGQHRHQRQRQDHRADQGEDDRQRHRPEQLAFDAFEREDRQVDDHDDQLAEHRRLADLDGGVADDLQTSCDRSNRREPGGGRSFRSSPPSCRRPCRSRWRPGSSRLAAMPNSQHAREGEQHRQRNGQRPRSAPPADCRGRRTARRRPAGRPRTGCFARCR